MINLITIEFKSSNIHYFQFIVFIENFNKRFKLVNNLENLKSKLIAQNYNPELNNKYKNIKLLIFVKYLELKLTSKIRLNIEIIFVALYKSI